MTTEEIERFKVNLTLLERGLEDAERFRERLEMSRVDLGRYKGSLEENLKFLRKKGIVSLMEEFSKAKKAHVSILRQLVALNAQIKDINLAINKQRIEIIKQRAILEKAIKDSTCTVLEFRRRNL
jgi:hypothetical protein